MKFVYCLITAAFITIAANAQDVAKADTPKAPAKAEAPATVELTTEQTRTLREQETKFRLISLEVENLTLKIQQAQAQLKELQDKAKTEQQALGQALTAASKIPLDKLSEYDIGESKDGKIVFTKKAAPPK